CYAKEEMKGQDATIRAKYHVLGNFHHAMDAELDKLVPKTWRGADGLPKNWLWLSAQVMALRITAMGEEYQRRLETGIASEIAESLLQEPVKPGIARMRTNPSVESRGANS